MGLVGYEKVKKIATAFADRKTVFHRRAQRNAFRRRDGHQTIHVVWPAGLNGAIMLRLKPRTPRHAVVLAFRVYDDGCE